MKVVTGLALVAAFAAGVSLGRRSPAAGSSERTVLYWHDPMHPEYRSDKPGIAPDCGMQLAPVYAGDPETASGGARTRQGAVHISSEKQQVIGVRVTTVEQTSGTQSVRTVGRVSVDERRVFRIAAASPGWIVDTRPNSVGSLVRKEETLATFYAREFLGAQQAYLFALDARDRFVAQRATEAQMASTNTQLQSATDNLQALGMSPTQIEELSRVRQKANTIAIRSPASGFIVSRNVSPGQRFDAGAELYVIADLRKVWVLADMFQYEANYIRAGQTARVTLPHQGRRFDARVSEVLPQFDPSSRTLKVRLEVDNDGYALRPGMFADVDFPLNVPSALTVPSDALLDSGLRKTVFVDLGDGYFEPRRVETGWQFGDRVQILRGLMAGERVVTSGNFLIDSESRLRAAAAGIRGHAERDVICGMAVDPARARAAHRTSDYHGATYYFCSDNCKAQFDATPVKYADRP